MASRRTPTAIRGTRILKSSKLACLKYCLVVLVLFWAGTTIAQNLPSQFLVTGTVFDPSGATTPSATVTLKQASHQVRPSIDTDSSGKFRFGGVPQGNY